MPVGNRYLDMQPRTDAQLFDMLFGLFGIGDYTPGDERPWHRFRMVEISKIKALRRKRRITIDQLTLTARWCYRRRIHITSAFGLTEHIGEALRERTLATRHALDERMAAAADRARDLGEADWAQRLLLAQGAYRQPLLDAWREHQQRLTSPHQTPTKAGPS